MSIRNLLLAAVLAASTGALTPALASEASDRRQAQDRAAIEQLMWDYASALDSGNAEAYAALYTQDGAFGKTQGREALKKMITDLNKSREDRKAKGETVYGTLHMTTDHAIVFSDPDHAALHYYWLTSFVAPPTAPGATRPADRVPFSGHGIDTLVRIKGKWLIKYRDVTSKDW